MDALNPSQSAEARIVRACFKSLLTIAAFLLLIAGLCRLLALDDYAHMLGQGAVLCLIFCGLSRTLGLAIYYFAQKEKMMARFATVTIMIFCLGIWFKFSRI